MTKRAAILIVGILVGLAWLALPTWRLWIIGLLGLAMLVRWIFAEGDEQQRGPSRSHGPATGATNPDHGSETEPPPPAIVPLEDWLDLHAFAPREVVDVAEEYLFAASAAGFREVRIVHGRGTGFQRRRVREMLARHPTVESYSDAPPERGGWGATVVRLSAPSKP